MKKFVGIVGSNAELSYNRKLLEFIRRHLFNQDEDWQESFQLRYLYNKITRADGVIIATAEHNHTTPGPLKSALEW